MRRSRSGSGTSPCRLGALRGRLKRPMQRRGAKMAERLVMTRGDQQIAIRLGSGGAGVCLPRGLGHLAVPPGATDMHEPRDAVAGGGDG